jgi:glycosyl transferase, family 25
VDGVHGLSTSFDSEILPHWRVEYSGMYGAYAYLPDSAIEAAGFPQAETSKYINADIPVYFVNRDVDLMRRHRVENQLEQFLIKATRISGVDGLAVPVSLHDQFFTNGRLISKLKPGEVGCYASHLLAMQAILDDGHEHAIILEDDAVIDETLIPTVREAIRQAPAGWGMMNLCRNPSHSTRSVAQLSEDHEIVRCSRLPPGMVGYLLSRKGAELLTAPRKRHFPSDVELRAPWLFGIDIYCVVPQLVRHDDHNVSVIGKLGGQSRLRRGFPLPTSYCWTGNPLHTPRSVAYNISKLGVLNWSICAASNVKRLVRRRLGDIPRGAQRLLVRAEGKLGEISGPTTIGSGPSRKTDV